MQYAYDPHDFFTVSPRKKAKFSGPCKFHKQYFNKELIVERDAVPSVGYYICHDCRAARMKERELTYTRKNGKPVRRNT